MNPISDEETLAVAKLLTAEKVEHLQYDKYWSVRLRSTRRARWAVRLTRKVCIKALDDVLGVFPRDQTTRQAVAVAHILYVYSTCGERKLSHLRSKFYWSLQVAREEYRKKTTQPIYWPVPWPEMIIWKDVRARYLYGQDVEAQMTQIAEALIKATAPSTRAGEAYLGILSEARDEAVRTGQLVIDDFYEKRPKL